jgi:pimeloyl-ACP methyl ester carboxylesterase
MPLRRLDQATGLVHQAEGDPQAPAIIYLPGVHGDWTPQVRARPILSRDFHFVETAYPRTHHWSIDDYARALKELLDDLGIDSAHIVGESFGSLVAWKFGIANPERFRSFTLVGGFSRPPRFRVAAAAAVALKSLPTNLLEAAIDLYVAAKSAAGEHRETFQSGAYPAARTVRGRRATANRMTIIQESEFQNHLQEIRFPVRYVGGARDIVVPVRREIATLGASLPPHCDFQSALVAGAPHALIASHPEQTVQHILRWVRELEDQRAQLRAAVDAAVTECQRFGKSS